MSTLYISEEERLAVMRDKQRRESYVSYIASLYEESLMWDRARSLLDGLLVNIIGELPCVSATNNLSFMSWGNYCDPDTGDLCAACQESVRELESVLRDACKVHEDLLKERGLHWKPFGTYVHLSSPYDSYHLSDFIRKHGGPGGFIDEMHRDAMKDFSLQPEDINTEYHFEIND